MNNNFKNTKQYKDMMKMRPDCTRVLREVFNVEDSSIIRYEKENGVHILDQEFAIDLKVVLPNGSQLSGQEKALTNKYYKYRTFTIEFYQNRHDRRIKHPSGYILEPKQKGEWFKIASQFYLSGYSDTSGIKFIEWKIIRIYDFMLWMKKNTIEELEKRCTPCTDSNANFLPIPYEDIPKHCIYAEGFKDNFKINWTVDDFFKIAGNISAQQNAYNSNPFA